MGKRRFKAAVIGSFVLGAGIFYFSDAGSAWAQLAPKEEKRDTVLASVADYKKWQLVSKPAPESPTDTFRIIESSMAG